MPVSTTETWNCLKQTRLPLVMKLPTGVGVVDRQHRLLLISLLDTPTIHAPIHPVCYKGLCVNTLSNRQPRLLYNASLSLPLARSLTAGKFNLPRPIRHGGVNGCTDSLDCLFTEEGAAAGVENRERTRRVVENR